MKKAIIATVMSGVISAPTFAANGNELAHANQIFNLDSSQSMELAVLSPEEMKSTEGAWINFAAMGTAGGFFGGLSYANSVPSSQRTWSGWTMAIGSGAAGGMIGGLPYGTFRTAFYGGSVGYVGNSWATSSWGRR